MRERVAVHQKQWRPLTAVTQNDVDTVHMKRFLLETFHHRLRLPRSFRTDAPAIDAICQRAWPASRQRHCDLKLTLVLAKRLLRHNSKGDPIDRRPSNIRG